MIAGPKALEHIVDTVLYFEGERHHNHRILRAAKNRFGAANELGIFEMTGRGLVGVPNPSEIFLGERPVGLDHGRGRRRGRGRCSSRFRRSSAPSKFGTGRRTTQGVEIDRRAARGHARKAPVGFTSRAMTSSSTSPAESRSTSPRSTSRSSPPSSRASAIHRRAATVVFGEVGLAGEVAGPRRPPCGLREAALMGFTRCVVPENNV